ncbi:MAG: tRNA pseudouridine(38-40) synthase TruA [Dysgonamonadaceae bacterium]|jgi:tRNA pseudouridine38-40 synthase|nr:tRNA pseudouridine(38-40) synthase TruA [Dysgonamonadaceae bacterium]
MKRYFIYFAYNGKNYCGWQKQPNGITVQERIEERFSTLLRIPVSITGAGRTDSGVHAKIMTAHFDMEYALDCALLKERLNRILPSDIAVCKIVPVKADAHARFDALSRTYKYFITNKKNPFRHELLLQVNYPLNYDRMNEAAEILLKYTDFTSFSKLHTDVKTNNCKIMKAKWNKENDDWVFTIQANRFLRNMVRAIVGTLIEVGKEKLSLDEFRKIIENKDRRNAGTSVKGNALFLTDIEYPESLFENQE